MLSKCIPVQGGAYLQNLLLEREGFAFSALISPASESASACVVTAASMLLLLLHWAKRLLWLILGTGPHGCMACALRRRQGGGASLL